LTKSSILPFADDEMHEPIGAQLPGINRVMLSILNRLGEVFPPMFSVKLARILGPIAAVFLILGLSGCGGAAGSSHQFIQISGPSITSQPVGPEITTPQTVTLTLKASGDALSGSISGGRGGPVDISDGKVTGDDITFSVVREFQGNSFTTKYKGKVSGDSMSGEMGIGPMGSFPFTGTRA